MYFDCDCRVGKGVWVEGNNNSIYQLLTPQYVEYHFWIPMSNLEADGLQKQEDILGATIAI